MLLTNCTTLARSQLHSHCTGSVGDTTPRIGGRERRGEPDGNRRNQTKWASSTLDAHDSESDGSSRSAIFATLKAFRS